jgi:hypothetical protein
VLDESIRRASAFSDEVLERVVRAPSDLRPHQRVPNGPLRDLDSRRNEIIGEVWAIFDALSPLMPTPQ